MEHICADSKFPIATARGTEHCRVDVYADARRHHFAVVFNAPRQASLLQADPHRTLNAFYREVLFRHLTPASLIRWYVIGEQADPQQIQLEGLPGGYTAGHLMPCLVMPVQVSTLTA